MLIATGRTWTETTACLEAIDHHGHVVAAGGSLLCHATGTTIERRTIGLDVVHRAVERLLDHGHRPLLLKDRHATGYDYLTVGPAPLSAASEWWFDVSPVLTRDAEVIDHDNHPDDTVRIGAVAGGDAIDAVARELAEALEGQAHLQHWSAVTTSHAVGSPIHLLEIFQHQTNKWMMIESYCAARGIGGAEVAAIGDGLNDVEMIANAGLGIAMENAIDDVKQHAAHMTRHHDEDGFRARGRCVPLRWVELTRLNHRTSRVDVSRGYRVQRATPSQPIEQR